MMVKFKFTAQKIFALLISNLKINVITMVADLLISHMGLIHFCL